MHSQSAPWLSSLEKRQEVFLVFRSKTCFWLWEENYKWFSPDRVAAALPVFGNKSRVIILWCQNCVPRPVAIWNIWDWWGEELISSSLLVSFSAFSGASLSPSGNVSCSFDNLCLLSTKRLLAKCCDPSNLRLPVSWVQWTRRSTVAMLSMGKHLNSQNSLGESWVSLMN